MGSATDSGEDDDQMSSSGRGSPQQQQQQEQEHQQRPQETPSTKEGEQPSPPQASADKHVDPTSDPPEKQKSNDESASQELDNNPLATTGETEAVSETTTSSDLPETVVALPSVCEGCEAPICTIVPNRKEAGSDDSREPPKEDSSYARVVETPPQDPCNNENPEAEASPGVDEVSLLGLSSGPGSVDDANWQRKAWGKLLQKRPKSEDHNSSDMLEWIRDILRVSDYETEDGSGDACGSDGDVCDGGGEAIVCPNESDATKRKVEENLSLPPKKKTKTKALLSRKEHEETTQSERSDYGSGNSNSTNEKKLVPRERAPGKERATGDEDIPDDASTSSEDSVDLRVRKKSRN